MQLINYIEITTRMGELDSFGHINNANYLRYIEHGRVALFIEENENGETKFAEVLRSGLIFVISQIDASFYFPLNHGQKIAVATYSLPGKGARGFFLQEIWDIARKKKAFEAIVSYAIFDTNNNKIVRLETDYTQFIAQKAQQCQQSIQKKKALPPWFLLPSSTEKKILIKEDASEKKNIEKIFHNHLGHLYKKFFSNATSINAHKIGTQMPISYQITTRFHELDSYRHINNAVYFSYCEEARWYTLPFYGFDLSQVWDAPQTVILGKQLINYRKQISGQVPLRVDTSILETSRAAVILHHAMYDKNEELIADGLAQVVYFDQKSGKPWPWPDEIKIQLEKRLGQIQ